MDQLRPGAKNSEKNRTGLPPVHEAMLAQIEAARRRAEMRAPSLKLQTMFETSTDADGVFVINPLLILTSICSVQGDGLVIDVLQEKIDCSAVDANTAGGRRKPKGGADSACVWRTTVRFAGGEPATEGVAVSKVKKKGVRLAAQRMLMALCEEKKGEWFFEELVESCFTRLYP